MSDFDMGNDTKIKSFWEKPEGTTGMIFMVAAGGAALLGLYKALPFLIRMAQNTIHLMFLLGVIGGVLYLILDPKFRTLISYGYKSIMKSITKMFVELDPIKIVEIYVDDMKDNMRKMNQQLSNLKGQMVKLKGVIEKNNYDMQNNLKLASKAKETGDKNIVILKSRKAGRLKESNMTLQNLYAKIELIYRILNKTYEQTGFIVEDLADEVSVKKREYEAIKAGYSAFKSAMKIINGDPDKRAMFEQAMEVMADRVGQQVGEIERFLEVSKTFMDSIDLQNGVFEVEGMEMLEKWEKESSLILGADKQLLIDMDGTGMEFGAMNGREKSFVKENKSSKDENVSYMDLIK